MSFPADFRCSASTRKALMENVGLYYFLQIVKPNIE
jgi:hypothetical protein